MPLESKSSGSLTDIATTIGNAAVRFFTVSHDSIFQAIEQNDLDKVKKLVHLNVNLEHKFGNCTPLYKSFLKGKINIFTYLLDQGASPNATYHMPGAPYHRTIMEELVSLKGWRALKLSILYGGIPPKYSFIPLPQSGLDELKEAQKDYEQIKNLQEEIKSLSIEPEERSKNYEELAKIWKRQGSIETDPLYEIHYKKKYKEFKNLYKQAKVCLQELEKNQYEQNKHPSPSSIASHDCGEEKSPLLNQPRQRRKKVSSEETKFSI